jgi:hypothetical protein
MAAGMAVAAGLTITALSAPAASANADVTGYDQCESPDFCLFEDGGGGGRVIGLQGAHATLPPDFDNITSSIWNRSGQVWCLYTGPDYTGNYLVVGNYKGDIIGYDRLNDAISSAKPGGC